MYNDAEWSEVVSGIHNQNRRRSRIIMENPVNKNRLQAIESELDRAMAYRGTEDQPWNHIDTSLTHLRWVLRQIKNGNLIIRTKASAKSKKITLGQKEVPIGTSKTHP